MTSIATQVILILPGLGYFTLFLKLRSCITMNFMYTLILYVNQQLHHKFTAVYLSESARIHS